MKILLVEDSPITVCGLKNIVTNIISSKCFIDVVVSLNEMINQIKKNTFSLLIFSIQLKNNMELETLLQLAGQKDTPPIFIFSENALSLPVKKLYSSGIRCLMDKGTDIKEVLLAIQTVLDGKFYVTSNVMGKLLADKGNGCVRSLDGLTKRENEIAGLLLKGFKNKEIEMDLNLKPSTVSTIKRHIFSKLHVKNIIELRMI